MNSSILVLWTTISVNTVPKFLIHNWHKNDLWFTLKSSIRPNCLLPFVSSSPLWRHPFYALSLSNNFFSSIQFHLSLFYLLSSYRPSPSTIISAAVVWHTYVWWVDFLRSRIHWSETDRPHLTNSLHLHCKHCQCPRPQPHSVKVYISNFCLLWRYLQA